MTRRNSPAAWNQLRDRVQRATASLSVLELEDRVARLQRRWKLTRRAATFDLLQELYAEQHRRRWAA